jgi:hypothetical protein
MLKAKIVYVNKEGTMGIVSIKRNVGPVVSETSGWMALQTPENKKDQVKEGDEFEIPANSQISTRTNGNFTHLSIN